MVGPSVVGSNVLVGLVSSWGRIYGHLVLAVGGDELVVPSGTDGGLPVEGDSLCC